MKPKHTRRKYTSPRLKAQQEKQLLQVELISKKIWNREQGVIVLPETLSGQQREEIAKLVAKVAVKRPLGIGNKERARLLGIGQKRRPDIAALTAGLDFFDDGGGGGAYEPTAPGMVSGPTACYTTRFGVPNNKAAKRPARPSRMKGLPPVTGKEKTDEKKKGKNEEEQEGKAAIVEETCPTEQPKSEIRVKTDKKDEDNLRLAQSLILAIEQNCNDYTARIIAEMRITMNSLKRMIDEYEREQKKKARKKKKEENKKA